MKKIISISILAATAVAALVSCVKAKEFEPVQSEGIPVTIVAAMPQTETVTKTELVENNKVEWTAGDRVGFVTGENDEVNIQSSEAVISDGLATFTGEVPAAGTYYAYYPYSTSYKWKDLADNSGGAYSVSISNEQHPSLTSFDPAADVLMSKPFEVTANGSYTAEGLEFRRCVAFIKVRFVDNTTGGKMSGEYASWVGIQGDQRINGRVDVFGDVFVDSGYKLTKALYEDNTFKLTENSAYFAVVPQGIAGGSSLNVTAETKGYTIEKTITLPADYSISGGQIQPIKITLTDDEVVAKPVVKLWDKLSTASASWMTTLTSEGVTGTAGTDLNIAIDEQYVYVAEFGASKKIWAIGINDPTDVKLVNTNLVQSVGFDDTYGTQVWLSCVRVVKKADGTSVLIASNLFQDGTNDATGRLYVWDNGIENDPRVITLQQWGAGRRLGDTFTTYGDYENCWLIFQTHDGQGRNGFVTFKLPTEGSTSYLISRLAYNLNGQFESYYPFPGEITRGMFGWRGGHGDYRNQLMTVADTEAQIFDSGAHTVTLAGLSTWMSNYENNNGIGYNYFEINGKRYIVWALNSFSDAKTVSFMVKQGNLDTDWPTIIDTAGPFYREDITGEMATNWKNFADCQVWVSGNVAYAAINKQNIGLTVYKLTL